MKLLFLFMVGGLVEKVLTKNIRNEIKETNKLEKSASNDIILLDIGRFLNNNPFESETEMLELIQTRQINRNMREHGILRTLWKITTGVS